MVSNVSVNYIVNSLNNNGNNYRIRTRRTKAFEDTKAMTVAGKCNDFVNKCRSLFRTDYSTGASTSVMYKMAKFVDSYNKLVETSSETSNPTLTSQLGKMKECITENESALKKIGITFKDDKLVINKDEMTKITSGSKLEKLFTGNPSFINSMRKYAEKACKSLKSQTVDTEVPSYSTISIPETASSCALASNNVNSILTALSRQDYSDSSKASITDLIKMYASAYNNLLDKYAAYGSESSPEDAGHMQEIRNLTGCNSAALISIGINISPTDDRLITDNDALDLATASDMAAVFRHSEYSDGLISGTRELFASLVKADQSGIRINGYA